MFPSLLALALRTLSVGRTQEAEAAAGDGAQPSGCKPSASCGGVDRRRLRIDHLPRARDGGEGGLDRQASCGALCGRRCCYQVLLRGDRSPPRKTPIVSNLGTRVLLGVLLRVFQVDLGVGCVPIHCFSPSPARILEETKLDKGLLQGGRISSLRYQPATSPAQWTAR
jgi:hypothetical protein